MGALGGLVGVFHEGARAGDGVPEGGHEVGPAFGVVQAQARAVGGEGADDLEGRGLADVIGVGLEGQAPHAEGLAGDVVVEVLAQLADQHELLGLVDALGGGDDLEVVAVLAGGGQHGADVLGEARATVTDAGEQELGADPGVRAHAAAHELDVGADAVGEVGHVVHERDARREVGVAGVLGELGRARVHEDHAIVGATKRLVEAVQDLARVLIGGAEDDAVGVHEVVDGGALLEELGVADDDEGDLGLLADDPRDALGGADGDRALVDDDRVAVDVPADLRGGRVQEREVGGAVGPERGRADRHEDDVAVHRGLGVACSKAQAAGGDVVLDQRLEARLKNGQLSLADRLDLGVVDVRAEHVVAEIREHGRRDEADISSTDDANLHGAARILQGRGVCYAGDPGRGAVKARPRPPRCV